MITTFTFLQWRFYSFMLLYAQVCAPFCLAIAVMYSTKRDTFWHVKKRYEPDI